jgi:tRNA dimethylallyltransferase
MIIAIVGPTGSGKSALAVELAKLCKGSIISCDSVQVYRGFNIGSGKVTENEKEGIPHYLLDIKDGNEEFTAGEFVIRAQAAVDEIENLGRIPIIVGGTGLYYRAFAYQYAFTEGDKEKEKEIRNQYFKLLEEKGVEYLYKMLLVVDEESARSINPNHSSRIIRALVFYQMNLDGIDKQKAETKGLRDDILGVYLDVNREVLYDNINKRVDKMIDEGLVEEVKGLLASGINEESAPMKTIGYKEIVSYLKGECQLAEAIASIKQNSRRYAKRQITWFKGHNELFRMSYNSINDGEKIIYHLLKYLNKTH